ncbi:hypothetical protein KVT40_008195 [Elsinoe batatas]|uniref:Uncharacterized protein n=1 Tax=Elsinoe batatas TaxID=2601811 RepID=A0A8K0PF54_9PEZI|nr:hypothetical protein KVT40_008195 [Elsinoe batatas]
MRSIHAIQVSKRNMQRQLLQGSNFGLIAGQTFMPPQTAPRHAPASTTNTSMGLGQSKFGGPLPEDPFGPVASKKAVAVIETPPRSINRTPKSRVNYGTTTERRRSSRLSSKAVNYNEDSSSSPGSSTTGAQEDGDDVDEVVSIAEEDDHNTPTIDIGPHIRTAGAKAGWPRFSLAGGKEANQDGASNLTSFTSVDVADIEPSKAGQATAAERLKFKMTKTRKARSPCSESTLSDALDVSTPSIFDSPRKRRRLDSECSSRPPATPSKASVTPLSNASPSGTAKSPISVDLRELIRGQKLRSSASASPEKARETPTKCTPKLVDGSPFRGDDDARTMGVELPMLEPPSVTAQLQASNLYSSATAKILQQHRATMISPSVRLTSQQGHSRPPSQERRYQNLDVSLTDSDQETIVDPEVAGSDQSVASSPGHLGDQSGPLEHFSGRITSVPYEQWAQQTSSSHSNPVSHESNPHEHIYTPAEQFHNNEPNGASTAPRQSIPPSTNQGMQPPATPYPGQRDQPQLPTSFAAMQRFYEQRIHSMRMQQVYQNYTLDWNGTSSIASESLQQPYSGPSPQQMYHHPSRQPTPVWASQSHSALVPHMQQYPQQAIPTYMHASTASVHSFNNSSQVAHAINPAIMQARNGSGSAIPSPAMSNVSFPGSEQLPELFPGTGY